MREYTEVNHFKIAVMVLTALAVVICCYLSGTYLRKAEKASNVFLDSSDIAVCSDDIYCG